MPYGFIKHIENNGYSSETVESYSKVTNQFFTYLANIHNKHIEPYEINPSDIKNYLKNQMDKNKSISTINKELAILKTMFHYLWEIDKAPVDPTVKIKSLKKDSAVKLEITYAEILDLLNRVLSNDSYSKLRKAIFLLATKGLKTADFRFKKDDVKDTTENNLVEIHLKTRIITLEDKEADYFIEYYYETVFNGSEYVFTTKAHGEEYGGPVQVMSILTHLRSITEDYFPKDTKSLTLISIRRAIAYDLYSKKVPIQQIAKDLGIEENSASNYLKHITQVSLTPKST